MSTFSIRYYNSSDGPQYGESAIDWNWMIKNAWARSQRDGLGNRWQPEEGLDEKAYEALLRHFGLEQQETELPLERVITMSPSTLADRRRQMEQKLGLPKKVIANDTLGARITIEEWTATAQQ